MSLKLSTKSRYGLRVMIAIARQKDGFARGEDLAAAEGLSKKYLDAILGKLRGAGFLHAAPGLHGGYRLSRSAEEITAADVVEVLDGKIAIVPCLENPGLCARARRCPTRPLWDATSAVIRRVMEGLTIADLARGGASVFAKAR